jgi:hypothetical protein
MLNFVQAFDGVPAGGHPHNIDFTQDRTYLAKASGQVGP